MTFHFFFSFDKEVKASGGITAYRFSPPKNVFGSVEENPENMCFCPQGPPCAPSGFFNISACQYGKSRNHIQIGSTVRVLLGICLVGYSNNFCDNNSRIVVKKIAQNSFLRYLT